MAANFYFVFVNNHQKKDVKEVIKQLGYGNFKSTKEVDIWETSKPENLFVGEHNGYLIFSEQNLPFQFYNDAPSKIEQQFCRIFPNTQISAFVINETVDMFGYAVIENGIRQRIKHGCDGEIYIDFGEQLPEEIEILKSEISHSEELEEMQENRQNIEAIIDFEASYRVTGRLISKCLGKEFYTLKDGEVKVVCYEKSST